MQTCQLLTRVPALAGLAIISLLAGACADDTDQRSSPTAPEAPSFITSLGESPHGPGAANVGKILFSSTHASPGDHRLYIVNPDGAGLTPLPDVTTGEELDPVWSPDFRRIAYTRRRSGKPDVVDVMNEDGTRAEPIRVGRRPRWSPDGRKLLFANDDGSGNLDLWLARPKSSPVSSTANGTRLTNTPEYEFDPTWSPDGSRIAFVQYDGNGEIWVMNADGTGASRIVSCTNDGGACGGLSWSPVPGDERIAYAMLGGVNELRIVDAATKVVTTVLTESRPTALAPSWAPDGSRIAFFSHRDAASGTANGDIYTIKPDGTDVQRVTQLSAPLGQPGWSR